MYGSGGSTHFAASSGRKVITVESDIQWLMELVASAAKQNFQGRIIPLWANIGETKALGYSKDGSMKHGWADYPKTPWQYCEEHEISPDLILIDSRFRVACFMACLANIKRRTKIVFDDYVSRKYYHKIEKWAQPTEIIDGEMAVFNVQPGILDAQGILDHPAPFSDPHQLCLKEEVPITPALTPEK